MELLIRCGITCIVVLAATGCATKPLRFLDAPDVVTAPDGVTRMDATPTLDVVTPRDAMNSGVPTSCAADPAREDCRLVSVRPQATFCIGVPATDSNTGWNASPPLCELSLSPFRVDAHEVSVGRFRVFYDRWVARTLPPSVEARFANGLAFRALLPPRAAQSEWNPMNIGCTWTETAAGPREFHPINCLSWSMAMYFCAWEGGHLLTATEYEYLARWHGDTSGSGRSYPWGEARPSCDLAQYAPCTGDDGLRTRRGGSLSLGSAAGVFDLAGNVAEMIADDFAPYPLLAASDCWSRTRRDPLCLPSYGGTRIARGSSWMNAAEVVLYNAFRPTGAILDTSPVRGFRCAYP